MTNEQSLKMNMRSLFIPWRRGGLNERQCHQLIAEALQEAARILGNHVYGLEQRGPHDTHDYRRTYVMRHIVTKMEKEFASTAVLLKTLEQG